MAFCSSCGGQLEGNQRFCAKCGADQAAHAADAPAVPVAAVQAPAPQAVIPPQPVQPYAAVPPQYPPPPVVMGAPPGAQPATNNTLMYVIVAAAIAFGIYYYNQNQTPAANPQTQPGQQPGQQPAGGGGGSSQAIIAAQKFSGSYSAANGQIQVSQGQWTNGSNVAVQAVKLGCEQEDANGQGLGQDTVTLTGPAPPGGTVTLPTFAIGAEVQGAAKVDCQITDAETTN